MKTELTAIFIAALIAVGGIGFGAAMPEDLVGYDTPSERAWAYSVSLEARLNAVDSITGGQYFVGSTIAYKEFWYYHYSDMLVKYTKMYNRIYITELTTDTNFGSVGNSSWTGRTGVNINAGDLIVVPYMQRQVDNKVAELESTEGVENIQVEIVIERVMTTYPGGPIVRLYHFEVTWDIYSTLY